MPRVSAPQPWHLARAIRSLGINLTDPGGYRAVARIYDRTTGNFKAVGWKVEVNLGDGSTFVICLLDSQIGSSIQTTL